MSYEFSYVLTDGRVLSVVGDADVEYSCDCYCSAQAHVHVVEHTEMSAVDEHTGLEVLMTDMMRAELEASAESWIYDQA